MDEIGSILKLYFQYHDQYTKKYGKNTVVLMQLGTFYEIYEVKNKEVTLGADVRKLADILDIQATRKNKNIEEINFKNPSQCGVPLAGFTKYRDILLNHNYTIVIVDQVTEPPNVEREVTNIISPGTAIENYNQSDMMNTLVSIYIDFCCSAVDSNKKTYFVGVSAIDISTGNNYVHKIQSTATDENLWIDELFRLIHFYSPKEILYHYDTNKIDLTREKISTLWELNENIIHINVCDHKQFHKNSYQNEYLKQIFPNTNFLSPIEYLGFERDTEITKSYIYMLQFIHEHKIDNLKDLPKPIHKGDQQHLVLSHNCMYQLYLITNKEHSSEKYNSLLNIINDCNTAIGRRLCKERLLYPIIDSNKLKERYELISQFQLQEDGKYVYDMIRSDLKKIIDVEKLHRKMNLLLLSPYQFFELHTSYSYVLKIINQLEKSLPDLIDNYNTTIHGMNQLRNDYTQLLNMKELEKYNMNNMITSVFNQGIYPDIDDLNNKINESKELIKIICDKLSIYIDRKKDNIIKNETDKKNGYHIYITENRSKIFKQSINNLKNTIITYKCRDKEYTLDLKDIRFIKRHSNVHIEFDHINDISNQLIVMEYKIMDYNRSMYIEVISKLHTQYSTLFDKIVHFIGMIDLNSTQARIAIENVYCCPEIIESDNSFFDARDIRHPIVEKVQDEIKYIPNDVSLSEEGILLFGTNACGKSTLMKSIGLTIIMAQAGFYVPCSTLKYTPYTQIFTRILNNDNLFKRQSSFAVEMSELRGILKRADNHSLVLGDELCSGTEIESALSIVAAGLKTLSDLRCSFIFTSHLHQLMNLSMVKELDNMRVNHLKIDYDEENETLVYDRKLEEGSGPPIYGLTVCKAMDLGPDFISLARSVQMELTDINQTLLNNKQSNYNAEVMMDKCQVCSNKSEHTHHIEEQCDADKDGIINHYHKNTKHNLVPLCESCHHKVHNENLRIYGYHKTNEGIVLKYEFIDMKKNNINHRKKFNEKQIKTILEYKTDILEKKIKKTQCIKKLELEHHIQISPGTLDKIVKGEY